tara:strand:+ start:2849 stop:3763 length:915 start_codon:yes stop_codon:yes gene_type:complete
MVDKRILITGCGGMLGDALFPIIKSNFTNVLATDIDANPNWLEKLDVRDITQCQKIISSFSPDIVFHLAALTDLEYCEKNPQEAYDTNTVGTENMAKITEKLKSIFIYISTAGIFDGEKEFYNDFDKPNPINIYGKSKYNGELFVQKNVSKYYIFRAGWMMGAGPNKDKKFINKIYKQIKRGNKEIFIVDDKIGSPTYTVDFSKSMLNVIKSGFFGLYNQVCKGSCSRFDVANAFVKFLNIQDEVKITKVKSDYFKKEYFSPRPHSENLINLKLLQKNMNIMRDWQECLKEYSEVFKKDLYEKI